jgi:hypothetical protein
MKQIPGQIDLFQYLETIEHAEDLVQVKGAVNLESHPISHYEVTLSYGDIVLIISMLRDYVKGLDEIKGDSIDWQAYYRNKFLGMADRMQQQIGYDYDKAIEQNRCRPFASAFGAYCCYSERGCSDKSCTDQYQFRELPRRKFPQLSVGAILRNGRHSDRGRNQRHKETFRK